MKFQAELTELASAKTVKAWSKDESGESQITAQLPKLVISKYSGSYQDCGVNSLKPLIKLV